LSSNITEVYPLQDHHGLPLLWSHVTERDLAAILTSWPHTSKIALRY